MGNHNSTSTSSSSSSSSKAEEYWIDETALTRKLGSNRALDGLVDLRQSECFPYPIPQDQGSEGSCVTYALATAYTCAERKQNYRVTNSTYLDSDHMFRAARHASSVTRPVSKGLTFSEAIQSIGGGASWFRLGKSVLNFKRCLALGYPVVVGFGITQRTRAWQNSDKQVRDSHFLLPLPRRGEEVVGFHCVLFVGYDDLFGGGSFIARNSWGEYWGHDGHFYFPYDAFDPWVLDAMVVDIDRA